MSPDSRHREVITIGASAGGVEALRALVAHLPADLAATVLVVLHVPRAGPSALPAILARAGPLPVSTAIDGIIPERAHIYVAPADSHLLLLEGRLRLSRGPMENGHRPAIDPLFRSAARRYGSAVIGVVLSGSRDDGAAGVLAIAENRGTVVVQDPQDALHASMPRAALDVVPDAHVRPASTMGALLTALVREPLPAAAHGRSAPAPATHDADLDDVDLDVGEAGLGGVGLGGAGLGRAVLGRAGLGRTDLGGPGLGQVGPAGADLDQVGPAGADLGEVALGEAEVRIADMVQIGPESLPVEPAGFGCPSCGGSLFEVASKPLPRYRCRVGHAWSARSLLEEQAQSMEGALWMALRALEEKAELSRRMAHARSSAVGRGLAARYAAEADEAERAGSLLRELIKNIDLTGVNDQAPTG